MAEKTNQKTKNGEASEITIDIGNQTLIKGMLAEASRLQEGVKLVLQSILNIHGADGNYNLSPDATRLIKEKPNTQ